MARHLSLSQAARLIGITRKDIQKKIQDNELRVMEGTVLFDDLRKAYPDAQFEDNTMLEKTQKLMQDAVYKMSKAEHEGARIEALSKRVYKLNQSLAKEQARAEYFEQILNHLRQQFVKVSQQGGKAEGIPAILEIQHWLQHALDEQQHENIEQQQDLLTLQIEEFMQPHIRLLPSRHDFVSDRSQAILESALSAGMAVDYGCNNGQCGKCKVRLLAGQVEQCGHSDYVFSAEEKSQNYILGCVNRAVTDLVLETREAISVDDIPKQNIVAKIKSLELKHDNTWVLQLKAPRSQRLRFLAGQSIELHLSDQIGEPLSKTLSIASCPCDDRNIQFHFPASSQAPLLQYLVHHQDKVDKINLIGPSGHFILDEQSPLPIVFIAENVGFASIKSLIEHALALDLEREIHLFWLADSNEQIYMDNICRAWSDALDHFHYLPIIEDQSDSTQQIAKGVLANLGEEQELRAYDYYISAHADLSSQLTEQLSQHNCQQEQIHINLLTN